MDSRDTDALLIRLVEKAGEIAGQLPEIQRRLEDLEEKNEQCITSRTELETAFKIHLKERVKDNTEKPEAPTFPGLSFIANRWRLIALAGAVGLAGVGVGAWTWADVMAVVRPLLGLPAGAAGE